METTHYGKVIRVDKETRYGHYKITMYYRGRLTEAFTTESACYDWIADDSNKAKHAWAKRYALSKIKEAYKNRIKRWKIF